jgi:Fe-S oxidoreductase
MSEHGAEAALAPHEQALELCTYCPKMCRHSCPVAAATGKESATPWALMGLANHVRKGHLALTPEIARAFYDCTNCLLCREYCLHGNDVPSALRAARALAVRESQVPEAVAKAAERFRRSGSMFPGGDREALAKSLGESIDPQSRSALLVSCLRAGGPAGGPEQSEGRLQEGRAGRQDQIRAGEAARDAASALARAGEACALPETSVSCCGAPLLDLGFEEEFRAHARKNAEALSRFERVICDTAVCARTLEREYAAVGVGLHPRVEDLVTALARAMEEGRLRIQRKFPQRAIYHDPCHLGRHAGVYDPPRALAATLFEKPPGEFPWSRENALCCGGSGGLAFVDPATTARMAQARVDQAVEGGFEMIVTASEECAAMLGEVRTIPVRTLASLVAEATAPEAPGAGRKR